MALKILNKEKQVNGSFNNGEIIEYKPIGFPQESGGIKGYSNLFYWAYAKSNKKSKIGLHPHKGFEIVSIVLKGTVNHYDTKNDSWFTLEADEAQVINAGSGISHSEELGDSSEIFQIWFDPDLSKTLRQEASYGDFRASLFNEQLIGNQNFTTKIIGKHAPIQLISEKVSFEKFRLNNTHKVELDRTTIYGLYLYQGELLINNELKLESKDFVKTTDEQSITLSPKGECILFIMSNPKKVSYKTYI